MVNSKEEAVQESHKKNVRQKAACTFAVCGSVGIQLPTRDRADDKKHIKASTSPERKSSVFGISRTATKTRGKILVCVWNLSISSLQILLTFLKIYHLPSARRPPPSCVALFGGMEIFSVYIFWGSSSPLVQTVFLECLTCTRPHVHLFSLRFSPSPVVAAVRESEERVVSLDGKVIRRRFLRAPATLKFKRRKIF